MSTLLYNPHLLPTNLSKNEHKREITITMTITALAILLGIAYYIWGRPRVLVAPTVNAPIEQRAMALSKLRASTYVPSLTEQQQALQYLSKSKTAISPADRLKALSRLNYTQ